MILSICYNNSCKDFTDSVLKFCEEQHPEISVKTFNEDHYQEKKKSYKTKGGYSARMNPFMLLVTDDNQYLKAFYSEDKGCTLDNLIYFLNNLNNENTRN